MRERPDLVESDLQRFHGIDLADYYRGGLSLRRISVLLADLFHAFSGTPHPSRPKPKAASRYSSARARLEAQRARLAATSPPSP